MKYINLDNGRQYNHNENVCDHFTAGELACKGTGVMKFHDTFLDELVVLRTTWGKPLTVNSCCRAPSHNKLVGGHWRSLHLTENDGYQKAKGTLAIDFSTVGWSNTDIDNFVKLALTLGWSVGISSSFIHVDRRVDIGLKQQLFFYNTVNSAKYNHLKQFV